MVPLSQIAMQLVDWTDPRRLVDLSKAAADFEATVEEDTSLRNRNIHVELAIAIMEQMKRASSTLPSPNLLPREMRVLTLWTEEERKVLCSMLGKLHITSHAEGDKLRGLYDCVCEAVSGKLVIDALSKASLNKLEQSLSKLVAQLENE